MEYLGKVNWRDLWEITKDILLPHTGKIVLNIILFLILGLVISIVYTVFLSKKNVFKRNNKVYGIIVKLVYIPLIIIGSLYIFAQIGAVVGAKKILSNQSDVIASEFYDVTINKYFKSDEEKTAYLLALKVLAKKSNYEYVKFSASAQKEINKIAVEDDSFVNRSAAKYLLFKYGDDIGSYVLYEIITAASKKALGADISDELTHESFKSGLDFLLSLDHGDIEKMIKEKTESWYLGFVNSQFKSFLISILLILIIIMVIPLIEFSIYKKFIEPKQAELTIEN